MPDLSDIFGEEFDPNEHEPTKDFEVLPPGEYITRIDQAEVKTTRKEDGHYVKLELTVVDGDYINRKLWPQINIDNPSQKCVEIGKGELSALTRALGIPKLNSVLQLLDGVVVAHVKVKNDPTRGDQNEVRTYSSVNAQTPDTPEPTTQSAPDTTQGPRPWER